MSSARKIRFARSCIFLLLIVLSSAAASAASVIVEFKDDSAAMAAARAKASGSPMSADQIEAYRAGLAVSQTRFLESLAARGVVFQIGGHAVENVRVEFRYTLVFNGINLLIDPSAVATVESMPEVKKVHADELLHTVLDASVPYIGAPRVYGAVAETSQFDDFREGFEGQGIYVSIIDSGVEWQHEMFGGDLTPPRLGIEPPSSSRNEKVVYYLPLADVVIEDGLGHGTHVAATAAGYQGFGPGPDGLPLTADDIKMHGVAPQARIMSYKVCSDAVSIPGSLTGAVGGCLSSAITMGLEDSMSPRTVTGFPKPVAHVINMSLGGTGGPDSVTSLASDNAARLGATVVAAAGNSGPGEGTAGAPCAGRFVTCVANSIDPSGSWSFDVLAASSVNRLLPGAVTPASHLPLASGQRSEVQLLAMSGTPNPPAKGLAQYYVYVAGGETPLSYPANVTGRIAIVRTTMQATFAQVANSAATAGAIAVIMRSDLANATAVKATIPGANLPLADFDYLVSLMGAGATPPSGTLSTFPIRMVPFYGNTTLNSSSSRGPVLGYGQIKPDVTAPGTNILAAVPLPSLLGVLAQSNYASISGTSMASPHVAGAAALVKQSHPSWSGDMIRTALSNTATNLRDETGAPKPDSVTGESVIGQGGGLIDVFEAVNVKALMGVTSDGVTAPAIVGSHSFGEIPAVGSRAVVTRTVRVSINDLSGVTGTYSLAVANNRGLELPGFAVSAPALVAVPANGSGTFDVTVSIDGSIVTSGDPIQVQWYIRASRQDGAESLSMPFYLRATRVMPAAAVLNPVSDDPTPDAEGGVDRDGRYMLTWSYPSDALATPCGYRIEEARPVESASLWYDDGEEPMLQGNSKWTATNWTSRPHPVTASLGYAAVYLDASTASLTSASSIELPPALVTLTFDSFEDIELDFDYGFVDVSTDGGGSWQQIARYTGSFSGQRSLDLSPFAGNAVWLRFRLVGDELLSTPAFQGWYIDNVRISAGAAFSPIATVNGDVHSLAIGGKQDGTYAYRVTALFDNCASSPFAATPSNIEQITVSLATAPPMAAFTNAPNPSDPGQTVGFDASASADQDEVGGTPGIANYFWSFGDGNTASTSAAVTTHAYAAAGTYRITLTVRDEEGETASTESLQTVREPNASVSGGGQVPLDNGKATFATDIVQTAGIPEGSLTWNDHGQKVKIQATRITKVERKGSSARIFGECTVNKSQVSTFVLDLVDNGSDGDTASIQSGTYSASGTIKGGGVTITP